MRVIAGRWKGRRLTTSPKASLRPTADVVKGAIFSLLADRVEGSRVADLCCGSGSLGIEALSRGAAFTHFVDIDPAALRLAGKNLTGCGASPSEFSLQRNDAERWAHRWIPEAPRRRWIVVADPPYGFSLSQRLWSRLLTPGIRRRLIAAVLEHGSDEAITTPDGAGPVRRKVFGSTALLIWEA